MKAEVLAESTRVPHGEQDPLRAALAYAARGWAVLPVEPRGKRPLTGHGVKDASRNPEVIRAWWQRWPDANVAVACGEPSGLLVVDLDSPDAAEKAGLPLPPAPTGRTARGFHVYYAHAPGARSRSVAPGVEVKAGGSYVLVPPSVHPSGAQYEWVTPPDGALPPPPEWALEEPTPRWSAEPLGVISEGERNVTLTSLAGSLRRRGLDPETILEALRVVNARKCQPPLPDEELQRIAGSAAKWPAGGQEAPHAVATGGGLVRGGTGSTPDGAQLLRDLEAYLTRYVVLPQGAPLTIAAWVLHTYVAGAFVVTPYLVVSSPERRCGKTLLLDLLREVVHRPLAAANISEAALFRAVDELRPTLLLDEAQILRERSERAAALHDLLCAGHRRGQRAIRMVGRGSGMEIRQFNVYGPKTIALIGRPTDVLLDRGIEIRMRRRAPHEAVERFVIRKVQEEGARLRAQAGAWGEAHREAVAQAYEKVDPPLGLNDRARDNWAPLFAVVAVADPSRLPELERASLQLSGEGVPAGEESLGVRLLADIHRVFEEEGVDRVPTNRLVDALLEFEESPWGDWQGRRLTPHTLARLLRPFDIRPARWREGTQVVRGYEREAFRDAWARYLTCEASQVAQPSIYAASGRLGEPSQAPFVTVREGGQNPRSAGLVTLVTLWEQEKGVPSSPWQGPGGEPPSRAGDGLGDADYEAIERAALQGEGAEPEWEEGWL